MKKVIILFFICVISACSKNANYQNQIKGSWHSDIQYDLIDSTDLKSQINYRYYEGFFSDNYFYAYSDLTGVISPRKYTIEKDSLYFHYNSSTENSEYAGVIEIINGNLMTLKDSDTIINLYRINHNKKNLGDFVIADSIEAINRFKKDIDSFGNIFLQRFNKKFKEHIKED